MNFVKEAILGTRNHRELLLEYAKRSGGYKPKTMPIDGDEKIEVAGYLHLSNVAGYSYFSVGWAKAARVILYTDLCLGCASAIQNFLDGFYGYGKCPYVIEPTHSIAHITECGHGKQPHNYSYFARS